MQERSADKYSKDETEARMQAALRGARRVGPQPKSSMTPKRQKSKKKSKSRRP